MKNLRKVLSYLLVAVLASVITMAVYVGEPAENYNKLEDLANLIEFYFIGETDRTTMEDAAAAAMVNSLADQWSHYLSAEDYRAYEEQMSNAYVGIGIAITTLEDGSGFLVTEVNKNSSAEAAGMKAGDVIVEVEGQPTEGMTVSEIRNMVRGEEGTQVKLVVSRDDERLELQITRKVVETPVTDSRLLEDEIGLITIYNFDDRCAKETIAAIEELMEQGAEALIFDVRGNPGGYKNELVQLLDYLLPEGPLFRSEDYSGRVFVDESDAACLELPMAVLVDAGTYSAAEFFAAALDEYDAAVVVGQPTTGKGYFQSTFELNDGSAVTISIGKYTTPNGVSLAGVGLTPEIPVELDEETLFELYAGLLEPADDPQVQAAVEALK